MRFLVKQFEPHSHFMSAGSAGFGQRALGDDAGVRFYGHMRFETLLCVLW